MFSLEAKVRIQKFCRSLSNMVMPNIGAFITWGIITALFIPAGWLPNEMLARLVGPMITYLLPLLIGFTGGLLVGGDFGLYGDWFIGRSAGRWRACYVAE